MAKTLNDIQIGVRYNAREDDLDLTTASLLSIVNRVYRRMCATMPFPELRRRQNLTTTVADQGVYTWDTLSNKYTDIKVIEIQNTSLDTDTFGTLVFGIGEFSGSAGVSYKAVYPPPTETLWDHAGRKDSQQIPEFYMRYHNGTDNVIEFRPAPNTTGQQIRVTGIIEPTPLTGSSSTTIFELLETDEALEHLIAAEILSRTGTDQNYANENRQQANAILSRLLGSELVPEELRFRAE